MITTSRNVWLGAHVTQRIKDEFRAEAERRKMSMSALVFQVLQQWLETAQLEQLPEIRSNKRMIDKETRISIKFTKDSFSKIMTLLPSIPGHIHHIGADGNPKCGCTIHMTSIICDKYTRPTGVMDGPCLTCGASQPEHVEKALAKEVDVPLPFDKL